MKNEDANGVFGLLLPEIGKAVTEAGYTTPSPIQEQSIPSLLKGRDMLGCAQTGTGKTAAFMLPILDYLVKHNKKPVSGKPRVLILAPTRELAAQISDSVLKYGRHTNITRTVIFGGVGQYPQVKALSRGVHIVAATPGRLLDLMKQGHIDLSGIDVFVLDEADRMLDMGFIPDIKRVIAELPKKRQSLFFSATMEKPVVELASTLVHNPVHVTIEPEKPAVDRITQKVLFVEKENKDQALVNLMKGDHLERVIIFTQMKHVANRVEQKLTRQGIKSASIHGNKSQTARTKALRDFKTGRIRALVATDIAARGIDVDGISHVINYDMPQEAETYVHRIGRTARAGADGDAISFCSARERDQLRAIEALVRFQIPRDLDHPLHSEMSMNATGLDAKPLPRGNSRGRSGGGQRGKGKPGAGRGRAGASGGHARSGKRPFRGSGRKRSNSSRSRG